MPTFTRKLSDLIQEDFDFGLTEDDYPIFDEVRDAEGNVTTHSKHRKILNDKLLKHYWNYEIGQETESMFRFSLNRKMNEIMPYYNQLYLSTKIVLDPITTAKYSDVMASTNEQTGTNDQDAVSSTDATGKSRSVASNTPQVQLSGNEDYASNASDVNSASNTAGTTSANGSHTDSGSGTMDRTINGYLGRSPAELLMQFRAAFVNVDMEIITNLETLFMQIWDNGDEFTGSRMDNYYGFGFGYGIGWL